MDQPLSIRDQLCPNALCSFYGKAFAGNIVMHSSRSRRLRCKCCGRTWVAHYRDPHFRLKTEWGRVERVFELLRQGLSVRETAKAIRLSPSTVQRWKKRFQALFNS